MWSGNSNAKWAVEQAEKRLGGTLQITHAAEVDPSLLNSL